MVTKGINLHPAHLIKYNQGGSCYSNERQCDELTQHALVYRRDELSQMAATLMVYALRTRQF